MFRRQIAVIGKDNQKILSKKTIMIVGCGGLGNALATILSCIGLKKIILVDFDTIEIHNIHRQFQFKKEDTGKKKCEVLKEKIKRCGSEIISVNKKFDENINIKADLIFDATDNLDARKQIDKKAKKLGIPWIYASVEEWVGQVGVFINTSFDMFSKNSSSKGQIPPMVSLVAGIQAVLGLKALINEQKEILYFIDFNEELKIRKFNF